MGFKEKGFNKAHSKKDNAETQHWVVEGEGQGLDCLRKGEMPSRP